MTRSLNKRLDFLKTAVHCLHGMFKERLFGKRTPLSVVIYLTYRCNLKCPFCSFWDMKEDEMSTADIFALIDQLKSCGTQRLGLMGGEAVLRDDIGQIIEYSKKKGLITTLCSNGKAAERKIKELKSLDILILSLDGPKDMHDNFRGEGSYEAVIKTLEAAKNEGMNIWLTTLLMKENIEYIDYMVSLAQKYDIQCSFQPAVYYSGAAKDMESFLLSRDEIRGAFQKLIDYKKINLPIALSRSYLEYIYKFWPEINSRNLRCFAGRLFCVISPAGYVFPCQPEEGNDKIARLSNSDFKKAFYGLSGYSCKNCFCDSFIETNLLFNADFFTMWNIFKSFILK